jgi:choice-of-anchor A domain-containing protein
VGETLTWRSGFAYSGNIVAPSASGIESSVRNSLAAYNCRLIESAQIKSVVSKAREVLKQTSKVIGALEPTGEVSIEDGGVLVAKFARNDAIQVIQLDASMLTRFWTMDLRGYDSAKSFLVINVLGTSGVRIESKNLASLDPTRTLWNLPEHDGVLVISTIEMRGSLLAPNSDIAPGTGVVIGQVIVRSNGGAAAGVTLARPYSALQFNQAQCVGLPLDLMPKEVSTGFNIVDLENLKAHAVSVSPSSFALVPLAVAASVFVTLFML